MDILMYLFVFLPIFGSAIILSPIMPDEEKIIRNIVKGLSYIVSAFVVIISIFFDFTQPDYCIESSYEWMNTLGINASFMADSLSVIFCVISAFIFAVVIHINKGIKAPHRLYYALITALQTAVNGMLLSKDIFLYFTFALLALIPTSILITKWGSSSRESTSNKNFFYKIAGLVLILIGFLLIYYVNFKYNGILSSDLNDIDIISMPENIKTIILICLSTGFFINLAIFPFHRWQSDAVANSPVGVGIIISTVLNLCYAFGFIRFVYCPFDYEVLEFSQIICLIASLAIIYSAIIVLKEFNLKQIISYSVIFYSGMFLLGLSSENIIGITGGIITLMFYPFIITGLFIAEKHIFNMCGTDNIVRIQGLYRQMPRLAIISFVLFALMPLLCGFASVLLCINGAFTMDGTDYLFIRFCTILSAAAIFILAAKYIYVYCKMFAGINILKRKISDIGTKQFIILVIIAAIILFISIFFFVFSDIIEIYINQVISRAELFNGIN